MSSFQSPEPARRTRRFRLPAFCVVALATVLMGFASPASAEFNPGWGKWWLPPVHSVHGPDVDMLFYWIFWITMITFVLVEALLIYFLIKYRDRPEKKKAHFTHGNTRLEMAWTVAPAIILAALALGSKNVWDKYRFSPSADDPNRALVLVIGQQFKWNFVYPGPDGKLGKYLLFPKPTDAKWPAKADGTPEIYKDVPGPASLPYTEAVAAINSYIDDVNPLGKDFSDPDGKDDNWEKAPGRALVLPAHRPIEVQLSSKDVIHDFFLPNFRVKLDAVPGMRGKLYFESTMSSTSRRKEGTKVVPIDQLDSVLSGPGGGNATIIIDETAPGTEANKDQNRTRPGTPLTWRYFVGENKTTIIRNGGALDKAMIGDLKTAGLKEVKINIVEESGDWELVCEELCGQGHNTMTAVVTFLEPADYDKLNLDKPYKAPTAAPTASAAQ